MAPPCFTHPSPEANVATGACRDSACNLEHSCATLQLPSSAVDSPEADHQNTYGRPPSITSR